MNKFARKSAIILLTIICTVCLACGLSACKPKKTPISTPENETTYRLKTPGDGSLPTAHTALENIGYMAYTLDNQPYYHSYARNSSKAMGYEQITQSWKDHKGEKESGYVGGATVSSDLSYSALSKAATQGCFIGNNDGYMRGGAKPGKNTTATTANWDTKAPTYYDKKAYLYKYGEFPNEISVYVINENTIKNADEVVDNGDGTYSQKFYLKNEAACWYQYGLKTRASLKGYPQYKSIVITFKFDAQWQILESYCEEKTKIAPSAMGGIETDTTSKTTATYTYGADAIDEEHYSYLENYYKEHLDNKVVGGDDKPEEKEPDLTDILAGGFSNVLTEQGQQFNISLTLGGTAYDGKIFARLTDLKDVLNSLDVRVALGKAGTGKQDLFIQFAGGEIDAYYSTDFALTANIGAIGTVIDQFKDWAKRFEKPAVATAAYSPAADGEDDDPLAGLLSALKKEVTETSARISLVTDNLLGTGIGADVKIDFSRTKGEDGDVFAFSGATLGGITYSNTGISLNAALSPDNSGAAVITRDKSQTAVDLVDYANNVYNLLNSNTLKVSFGIDGTKEGVINMLSGLKIDVDSYVELGSDTAAKVDLSVALGEASAKLSAYYNVNIHSGSYGTVYLTLNEVNGKPVGARILCNINSTIDAVKDLVAVINGQSDGTATPSVNAIDTQTENRLAVIINKVLNLDFSKVFGEIYAANSEIRVSVSVDEILGGLGINFDNVKFGNAALALGKDGADRATLSLGLAALGLEVGVTGSDATLTVPDESLYTDVNVFIELVKSAVVEVNKIIAAKDVAFDVDARITADGVTLAIKGNGEAVWGEKKRVALDLEMYVADGTSAAAKDKVSVKFLYDETASDGSLSPEQPVALLSVNGLGLKIYRSDVDGLKDVINEIKNALAPLLGGDKQTDTTVAEAVNLYSASLSNVSGITGAVENILQSENVQTVLKTVLDFIGNLTVELTYGDNGEKLESMLIKHAVNGSLALGVDNNLWIDFTANNNDGTEIAYANAKVTAGKGNLAVDWTYDGADIVFASTDVAGDAFTEIIYNYLFAVIEDLTVQNVLGTDTYTVSLALNGSDSSIQALAGIKVNANLYYTHGIVDGQISKNKLVEADIDLDINGTPVSANARYADEYIFIELRKIANITLTNIKVRADVHDIYSAVEQVIQLITDTDLLSVITGKGNGDTAADVKSAAKAVETKSSLTDVIFKILTLDFSKAVNFSKVDGVNTVTVNPDYVLGTLGIAAPEIGTVTIGINPETHSIEASVKTEGAKASWLTLSAVPAERRVYDENWKNGYTDISFMSQLVSDVAKTAFTDGKLNTLYTFAGGHIDIDIAYSVISVNIDIDNVQLTAGLDENGKFYLSVKGDLQSSKALGFVEVSKQMGISVTYSNGYVTMGRNTDTTPIYKVMTIEYLLDNLLDKENSPIRWLLGTNSTAWNLIADNVKLNIQTGLTKPKDYYLYSQLAEAEKDKKDIFVDLAAYVNAIIVNSGGYTADFNDSSSDVLDKLGLGSADNYYAFDINPDFIGTISSLKAALLRDNAQGGLTGLKAYASIGSNLMLTVDLNGLTTDKSAAVPDYFNTVVTENNVDFNHAFTETQEHRTPIFGCYNSEDNSYLCSMALEPHTLTVISGGEVVYTLENIGYGSTVYLTNVFAPDWADEGKTSVYGYTDEGGNPLGNALLIESDVAVYVATVNAYPVNFHIDRNGLGTIVGAMTMGGALPEYPSDFGDYTFAGWFTDENYTTKVENYYAGLTDVYAKYVLAEYVAENGVKYTMDSAGFYTVTGFDADKLAPYTQDNSWLILENEIDGYPVTGIAAEAFANSNVKNVVAPENITSVGSRAFLDNYGIKTAVFTADSVHFAGTDKNTVFYGCSESNGGKTTQLKVYYNEVTADAGNDWTYFRDGGCYIGRSGGGELHAKGTWSFVLTEKAGSQAEAAQFNIFGIQTGSLTVEQITAQIVAELNAKTAPEGYINAYNVAVTNGYTPNGKINTVTVHITEAEAYWYSVTVSSGSGVSAYASGDYVATFNGTAYALAGSVVALKPESVDYYLTSATSAQVTVDANGYTFTMPSGGVEISVVLEHAGINSVTLTSNIAVNGYELNNGVYVKSVDVTEADCTIEAPVADGYIFLGWAYEYGGSLTFTGSTFNSDTVKSSIYYAVWAYNGDGKLSADTAAYAEGTNPNADISGVRVDTSKANSFYKWYTDSALTAEANVLNTSCTVLYGRVYYTLTVNAETNVSGFGTSKEIIINGTQQSSYSVKVLEGEVVYTKDIQGDKKVYNIMTESDSANALVGEIRIKTKNSLTGSNNTRELTVSCTDANWNSVADHLPVTGNLTFKFVYNR